MADSNLAGKLAVFIPLLLYFLAWFQYFVRAAYTDNRQTQDYSAFVNDMRAKKTGKDALHVYVYRAGFYMMIAYEFFTLFTLAFREGSLLSGDSVSVIGTMNLHIEDGYTYRFFLLMITVIYSLLAYFSCKKWHKIPMKNPIFTTSKGFFATMLAEILVIPVVTLALESTECDSDGKLIPDSTVECWNSAAHFIMLACGLGVVYGIIPLALYFAMHKNQFGTSGYYFLPEFNVILVFCKCTTVGFISASESPIASASFLICCFACLFVMNYWKQPCMGASVKPNCWRSASFLLCTWSAVCALWGAVKCHGVDDCDLTLVIIVLFAVAVPLGVAMWFLNRPRAKRLSPQGLFEDNAAVKALTSSALVETDDRKAGLALIEAIRNAKRGGTSMVMDLFASSTAKDLVAMLKVGDVDVLTLGCEVMALLAIDDKKRNKMKELGARKRLFKLMEWDWPDLRLNAARAVTNLSFEGDPMAPPLMDLSRTSVEATDIMAMACYYSLETLDLSGCMHIGPQLGEALSALPNLKGLSLARVKGVNNEQIIMVTETIPGLTSLDVSDCFKIKEQGIKAMAGLKELEHVNITCIPVMESSIRTVLSECTKLREVILAGTKCSNSCSHELKNLENLVKLDMRDTSIGDEALMELSPQVLQQMLELYVGSTFISDKALTFVAKAAQSMVKLSLAETNVTNAAIRSLESLRLTLKELDLSNCKKLTLEGGEIRGLQVLEVLNVADSAVGDDAVRFITQMDSLKELNVSGTDITDVSIDLVCESKAIHELNTNGCYHITPKAMAKWEKFSILRADDNPLDEKEDDETEENPMLPGVDRAADN